jgi:hypothetical protein
MPEDSSWFVDEYGPDRPKLDQEIKSIYEGNVDRGWTAPKLYATAFREGSTEFYFSQKPGENGKQDGGDLDGYFVYDQSSFRFVPAEDINETLP